ncbi:PdaC/SigV domain-containing protein [Paenibacillus wulumuqiensis]|uniref:PdaC/SigV domain-containing protein n=1 Tax=Paenibacillus wulumuqiensis TaxID=1567107 RepID=UPI0006197520|nr:DUF4163 domain-containing protein [Paenibacillus wulumuqiensis]
MNKNQNTNNTKYLKKVSAVVLATSLAVAGVTSILPSMQSSVYAKNVASVKSTAAASKTGTTLSTKGAIIADGEKMLLLTDLAKAVGATAVHDSKKNRIVLTKGKTKMWYDLGNGSVIARLEGSEIGEIYKSKEINGTEHKTGKIYVTVKAVASPFGYRSVWNNSNHTVTLTTEGLNALNITPAKLNPGYTNVHVIYPVISGLKNEAAQTKINQTLKAHYENILKSGEGKSGKMGASHFKNTKNEVAGDYKVLSNSEGVISFRLDSYKSSNGDRAAHSSKGMTFSLKDGKLIQEKKLSVLPY